MVIVEGSHSRNIQKPSVKHDHHETSLSPCQEEQCSLMTSRQPAGFLVPCKTSSGGWFNHVREFTCTQENEKL